MRTLMKIAAGLNQLKDIPPLLFRLLLAYGFYGTFIMKFHDPSAFAGWLHGMNVPGADFWAWVVLICEGLGVLLLFFGFLTRIITLPLITIMVVAIALVHWPHGYNPCENGFAIPLMFGLMLISILVTGPGRVSVDALITGAVQRKAGGSTPPQG